MSVYLFIGAALAVVENVYFKIATHFGITDKPNSRSSHSQPAIRGGGVVFIAGIWIWYVVFGLRYPGFILSATIAAVISFLDDVLTLPAWIRFIGHLAAILLLFVELNLFAWPVWLVVSALIICIGALNAINFMDGINGITGLYSLITLATFVYIDHNMYVFTDTSLIYVLSIALIVFLYYNFRRRARCFAGDVGSVVIGASLIFLLLQLIAATDNYWFVVLLLVYGTDAVVTILFRLKRKENIFKAHRTHLYQYLSNEHRLPQRFVSALYALVQLLLNLLFISTITLNKPWVLWVISISFVLLYLLIRWRVTSRLSPAVKPNQV